MSQYRFKVEASEQGMRLLAYLRQKIPNATSVKAIKRAIEAGQCFVNGSVEYFSTMVLAKGDLIEFEFADATKGPVKQLLKILFEDEDLLICDKPSGLVSENPAFNKLLPRYRGVLELVHRLDKETTGVILLAKNSSMRQALEKLFAKREVKKMYLAVVQGAPSKPQGVIKNYLAKKKSYQGQSVWGSVPSQEGSLAITRWKCLKKGKNASLILCEPETGRTHQIRVHMSEMGHPILGDKLYGRETVAIGQPKRALLHAYRLAFRHPKTQALIKVEAEIPEDFVKKII